MKTSKLILPLIFAVVIVIMYFTYFAETGEIGSFSKFSPGSEINQEINLTVAKEKGLEKDASGNITAFYARDKNNVEARIESHEPLPAEIANAEVVEVFLHMHDNTLVASKVTVIK